MSLAVSPPVIRGTTETLTVCRRNGTLEIYRDNFDTIYRCNNIHEGAPILRNELYVEATKMEVHRSFLDVTSPIDTTAIPLAVEVKEGGLTVKETLLANVNGKVLLLVREKQCEMMG